MKRNKLVAVVVLLLAAIMLLSACAASASTGKKDDRPEPTATRGPMDGAQELVDYIDEHGELPENFIRKKEAENLGWKTTYRYVSDLGPGITIGGDYFGNNEGMLPKAKGRKWTECDVNTLGARTRGPERIVFSNDGLIYYSPDHYESFEQLYG